MDRDLKRQNENTFLRLNILYNNVKREICRIEDSLPDHLKIDSAIYTTLQTYSSDVDDLYSRYTRFIDECTNDGIKAQEHIIESFREGTETIKKNIQSYIEPENLTRDFIFNDTYTSDKTAD